MSLHLLRKAHSNPVYLPGPGDADPPEDGPLSECPECEATLQINGEPCWFCQGADGEPKGYFYGGDVPMSGPEYERMVARMAEDN